jgi:hypothetical protein
LWQTRLGRGGTLGGVQWGMAFDGRLELRCAVRRAHRARERGTPGAQPAFGTHLRFDPKAGGGMHALDVETGKQVWKRRTQGATTSRVAVPASLQQ